jgi:hypothetical protein
MMPTVIENLYKIYFWMFEIINFAFKVEQKETINLFTLSSYLIISLFKRFLGPTTISDQFMIAHYSSHFS